MPKAEAGSVKHLSNQMKSKGLQRLRWFCQICEKQCRDENGFKCHVNSESHVRNMQVVGPNANNVINDYSRQFQSDFLKLLRTAHGEKMIHMNHFYQEYISDKMHIHMNATKWPSLTEFAKHLGREGICRIEDTEKGLQIAWIDNSPEALRRQDALRRKERQDKGDEEREQKLIKAQIAKAEADAEAKRLQEGDDVSGELRREEGEKIKLSFGEKSKEPTKPPTPPIVNDAMEHENEIEAVGEKEASQSSSPPTGVPTPPPEKAPLKIGINSKPKNVFASGSKKNVLGGSKAPTKEAPQRPMSQAEKIMKEELERKRRREDQRGPGVNKKPKVI